MTNRKKVIERWAECFAKQDWKTMLTLFTDDVERWEVGAPHRTHGQAEFEREVLPGPEVDRLGMHVDRIIEEGPVLVADGTAQVHKKDGTSLHIQFCDIFEFDGERIRRITAYGAVLPAPTPPR